MRPPIRRLLLVWAFGLPGLGVIAGLSGALAASRLCADVSLPRRRDWATDIRRRVSDAYGRRDFSRATSPLAVPRESIQWRRSERSSRAHRCPFVCPLNPISDAMEVQHPTTCATGTRRSQRRIRYSGRAVPYFCPLCDVVGEQEVGGSNPLAPTDVSFIIAMSYEMADVATASAIL